MARKIKRRKASRVREKERVVIVPSSPDEYSDYRLVLVLDKGNSSLPIRFEGSDYDESVHISLTLAQARTLSETLAEFFRVLEKP